MTSDGYPTIYNQDQSWNVARLIYTIQFGPLLDRVQLYSTCGVPRCCNPLHRMAVETGPIPRPQAGQVRGRYPMCRNGHILTPQNVYLFQGKPMCRDCRAAAQSRYRQNVAINKVRGRPFSASRWSGSARP